MFVEVAGKEKEIYVGEPLELTLRVWVRPYRDTQRQITLSDNDMWRSISDQSNWGAFTDSLQQMAENRERPRGRQVLRADSDGNEREYLLYEIEATVYPTKPGRIDAGDVRVVLNYPTALGRSRGLPSMFDDDDFPFGGSSFFQGFGSGLAVTSVRPIVGEATVEPINVKPIPQQGRPSDYQGAVGEYSIATEATPTKVKVGDPITLHIGIGGDGPMDLVRAPPLASQKDLIADFKVPGESLAGFSEGRRKIFTTTIRPRHEGVTQIPPITLSYFDPKSQQFVTVRSDLIAIEVEKAEVLALDAILGKDPTARRASQPDQTPTSSLAGPVGSLALFTGDELLQNKPRQRLVDSPMLTMLLIPPGLFALFLAFACRSILSVLVSDRRRFSHALASAATSAEVADALETFLVAKLGTFDEASTRDQTVGQLRRGGKVDLAIRAERLYAKCERSSHHSGDDLDGLKEEARQVADEAAHPPRQNQLLKRTRQVTTSILLFAVVATPVCDLSAADKVVLSQDQQRLLLQEALSEYTVAMENPSPEEPEHEYADAAGKFQLLVDSGIHNDQLFFNLGNARLQSGDPARAIAAYRSALRLDPANPDYQENLHAAQQQLDRVEPQRESAFDSVRRVNDLVLRFVSPWVVKGAFLTAWAAFWGILALRLANIRYRWKSAATVTLLIAAITGGSYAMRVWAHTRDNTAVLVNNNLVLRKGDGEEFPVERELNERAGEVVQVLDHRGTWTHIRLDNGTTGWIDQHDAQSI